MFGCLSTHPYPFHLGNQESWKRPIATVANTVQTQVWFEKQQLNTGSTHTRTHTHWSAPLRQCSMDISFRFGFLFFFCQTAVQVQSFLEALSRGGEGGVCVADRYLSVSLCASSSPTVCDLSAWYGCSSWWGDRRQAGSPLRLDPWAYILAVEMGDAIKLGGDRCCWYRRKQKRGGRGGRGGWADGRRDGGRRAHCNYMWPLCAIFTSAAVAVGGFLFAIG